GKTCRMLQEAHTLLRSGMDVKIALAETHGRAETESLLRGLPAIPLKKVYYKGKELSEMDLEAVLALHPEVVIVDELAHSNIPGSRNEKRWQDVLEILEAGINVISAVNIQHIESLNGDIQQITGVEVRERIPDRILAEADEVVNIDLTAEELITRLKEGRIYRSEKIAQALSNFFVPEQLLQLRELALKEVASHVERKVEREMPAGKEPVHERFLACISTNERTARNVIRKTARLANYYQSKWYVLYVQTPAEGPDRIPLDKQRHLLNNFRLVSELGGELVRVKKASIADSIIEQAEKLQVSTVCIGKPHLGLLRIILSTGAFHKLLRKLSESRIDLIILS
ncbi:MAG: sensor protein KdpD, partial [Flavobacteriales bacterium]